MSKLITIPTTTENEQGGLIITGTKVGNKFLLDVKAQDGETKITDGTQTATITDVAGKKAVDVNVTNIVIDLSDSISTFDLYSVNNLEDATPLYVGKSKLDGTWLVERLNDSTGEKDYANISNNLLVSDYASAWSNRLTLDYKKIHLISGV